MIFLFLFCRRCCYFKISSFDMRHKHGKRKALGFFFPIDIFLNNICSSTCKRSIVSVSHMYRIFLLVFESYSAMFGTAFSLLTHHGGHVWLCISLCAHIYNLMRLLYTHTHIPFFFYSMQRTKKTENNNKIHTEANQQNKAHDIKKKTGEKDEKK